MSSTWSDEAYRAAWAAVSKRDEEILRLREELREANDAVGELQAMVNRAHTEDT